MISECTLAEWECVITSSQQTSYTRWSKRNIVDWMLSNECSFFECIELSVSQKTKLFSSFSAAYSAQFEKKHHVSSHDLRVFYFIIYTVYIYTCMCMYMCTLWTVIVCPHQGRCFFIGGAIVTDHVTHHMMYAR